MRTLADLLKDRHDLPWSHIIVEILAAQTLAVANYRGRKFTSRDELRHFVDEVAGYPMLNRMSDRSDINENVGIEAALRVGDLMGLPRD